jgi:hypothetical protein
LTLTLGSAPDEFQRSGDEKGAREGGPERGGRVVPQPLQSGAVYLGWLQEILSQRGGGFFPSDEIRNSTDLAIFVAKSGVGWVGEWYAHFRTAVAARTTGVSR